MNDGTLRADASGFVCPRCGGALWERLTGDAPVYECRIGDRFSDAELWIEHSMARNGALLAAARVLAEHAALARRLAASADQRGDVAVASRLHQEATGEDQLSAQVRAMLDGLPTTDGDASA